MEDQESGPARQVDIAFSVGFVSLIVSFYVVAGLGMWDMWHALMAH